MQQVRPSSGRLILPASPEPGPSAHGSPPTIPGWAARPTYPQNAPAPHAPGTRLKAAWRKDPIHLVLALAVALVVVAIIVFVAFGATALLNSNTTTFSQTPTAPTPSGTVDNKPGFGTPGTNKGSSQSSQPATGPTPGLHPTANAGTLAVQIVNIPNVVANNTKVRVFVLTSEPGVSVTLRVTYNAAPFFFSGSAHTTDDSGQAILPWSVRVFTLRNNPVQATVQVIATGQDGQRATSQPVVVTVEG